MAAGVEAETTKRVRALAGEGVEPRLGIVLAGDDPGSKIYTSSIERASSRVGVSTDVRKLPSDATQTQVAETIDGLNANSAVHGIIVQQPLPKGIEAGVVDRICVEKDIDGASSASIGRLAMGRECFAPCTARGVVELLVQSNIEISGKHVVIVGRSTVVGKPLASLLLRKSADANATVTVCHTGTADLAVHTRMGDIIVAAMGAPGAISAGMVREGAVVVDVGVNRISDPETEKGYRIVGDVAFEDLLGKAAAITPVPGGVGSLTTAILVRSAVEAAELSLSRVGSV